MKSPAAWLRARRVANLKIELAHAIANEAAVREGYEATEKTNPSLFGMLAGRVAELRETLRQLEVKAP